MPSSTCGRQSSVPMRLECAARDAASCCLAHSALPPHQLFGGFVEADEFYYPDFKSLESSELTKEQKVVVDICKACFPVVEVKSRPVKKK